MAVLPSRKCDSDWVWWVLKFTPLTLWRGCEGDSVDVKLTRLKMSYCLRETSSFSLYSDFFTVSLQRCFWAAENKPRITITISAEHFIYSESARRVVFSHSQTSRCFTFTNFTNEAVRQSAAAPLKSHRTPAEDFTAQNRHCVRVRVDGKPIQCMKTTSKKYTRLVLPTPAEHENPSAWRNLSHKITGRKYFVFVEPSDNVFF